MKTTIHARGCLNALTIAAFAVLALLTVSTFWALGGWPPAALLLVALLSGCVLTAWIALTPRRIDLDHHELQLTRLFGRHTLPADRISAVQRRWFGLQLHTAHGTLLVPSLDATFNAEVATAARELLPQPAAAHRQWLAAGLPLTVPARRSLQVLNWAAVAGLLVLAAAIARQAAELESSETFTAALLFAGVALLLAAALLFWSPLAVHFDQAGMTIQTALRRNFKALPDVRRIDVLDQPRRVRRIERRIALIRFTCADGSQHDWLPFEDAFPQDYVEAEIFPLVDAIAARLRVGYLGRDD